MNIYHYNEYTGELLGAGLADPDPLVPDNWLIPAHATTVEPPSVPEGQFAAWTGNAWELRDIPQPTEEQPDTPKAEG